MDISKILIPFLKVEDSVKVKVLSIDGNKIGLSIRQTQPKEGMDEEKRPHRVQSKQSIESFEAKMKSFLRDSNERLHDLKRNTEGKRGGRVVVEINSERWHLAISLLMYRVLNAIIVLEKCYLYVRSNYEVSNYRYWL